MDITINELLQGKSTIIKNKNYFPTKAYVEPFLEQMSKHTDDFRISVKIPDQLTTLEGDTDITYNRVLIQAVMPDEFYNNHREVVGFLYGLDVRKPVVKLYRGGLNMACTNLCVFNPDFLHIQELQPETAINIKPVKELMDRQSDLALALKNLKEMTWDKNDLNIERNLGQWIRNAINCSYDNGFGKAKLATSTVIDAYKLLFEKEDSPYFIKDDKIDGFTIYNAFTELISNDGGKDIFNKTEKTLLLREILEF